MDVALLCAREVNIRVLGGEVEAQPRCKPVCHHTATNAQRTTPLRPSEPRDEESSRGASTVHTPEGEGQGGIAPRYERFGLILVAADALQSA